MTNTFTHPEVISILNRSFSCPMKIVHLADTHIGYSRYNRIDPQTGLNVREKDVYDAFNRAVDMILKIEPDVVIHAGDLFDSVRPTNRALSVGIGGLLRLADAGIEVIVISGNHSTPRLRETGSPFRLMEREIIRGGAADRVHPIFKGVPEKVILENTVFHGIPHMPPESFSEAVRSMMPEAGLKNVAIMHAGYIGLRAFRNSDESNEILLKSSDIVRDGFDYIALGHYHGFAKVEKNAYYSGSTERFSFTEEKQKKGFIELDLETMEMEFHSLPTRPMMTLRPIDAKLLGPGDVVKEIRERVEEREIEGAMVRLRIENTGREVWQNIDRQALLSVTSPALDFTIEPYFAETEGDSGVSTAPFRGFVREFEDYYRGVSVERLDRERLKRMVEDYLSRVVSQ